MQKSHIHLTKHRLNRPIRLSIMIMMIAIFCIVSPIMIFYIAGYRYDFSSHQIKQTGVLSIDIEPKNAQVFLNDILIEKNIPIRLANRAPGTYNLLIQKNGFKPWHKDITIESNQTTYINDIILIREPAPVLTKTQLEHIIGIYGTQKSDTPIIMLHNKGVYEIVKYDMNKDVTIPLLRTTSNETPTISISPYRDLAMIHVTNGTEDSIHLVPLDTSESITSFSLSGVTQTSWYDNWFEPLVVHIDENIIALSPNKNQHTIYTTDSPLWYIDDSGNFWTYTDNILQHKGSNEQYPLDGLDSIVHINRNRIITQKNDTLTIINRHNDEVNTLSGTHTYYNDDNEQLLAWTPWELSVIYPDASTSLLNRSGDNIQQIHIFDKHNTLMFVTNNGIKTFDPRYYVGHHLFSEQIKYLFIATKKRELIYVNPQNNKLYKVDFNVQ